MLVAIVISIISIAISIGIARWTWLIFDEQVAIRQDFNDIEFRQEQVETQYEFWLEELESDLDEVKSLQE
jgi:hypothetical protein